MSISGLGRRWRGLKGGRKKERPNNSEEPCTRGSTEHRGERGRLPLGSITSEDGSGQVETESHRIAKETWQKSKARKARWRRRRASTLGGGALGNEKGGECKDHECGGGGSHHRTFPERKNTR